MNSHSVTAVTPFRLLDLPREVRDDIYEAAIFDLSPPDMFLRPRDPDSVRLRKMNTNVLLTNRQVYWEARDVIVRRGQLMMISIERHIFPDFKQVLMTLSGITGIDPMYRSLCIMGHCSMYQIPTYAFLSSGFIIFMKNNLQVLWFSYHKSLCYNC